MESAEVSAPRSPKMGPLARVAVVTVLVLAPVATGAVGYDLGAMQVQPAPEPTSYPVWTDQEIKFSGTGTLVATLRCTYHRADGTARVTETVVTAVTGPNAPRCP
jgi:hypothetical protein